MLLHAALLAVTALASDALPGEAPGPRYGAVLEPHRYEEPPRIAYEWDAFWGLRLHVDGHVATWRRAVPFIAYFAPSEVPLLRTERNTRFAGYGLAAAGLMLVVGAGVDGDADEVALLGLGFMGAGSLAGQGARLMQYAAVKRYQREADVAASGTAR